MSRTWRSSNLEQSRKEHESQLPIRKLVVVLLLWEVASHRDSIGGTKLRKERTKQPDSRSQSEAVQVQNVCTRRLDVRNRGERLRNLLMCLSGMVGGLEGQQTL